MSLAQCEDFKKQKKNIITVVYCSHCSRYERLSRSLSETLGLWRALSVKGSAWLHCALSWMGSTVLPGVACLHLPSLPSLHMSSQTKQNDAERVFTFFLLETSIILHLICDSTWTRIAAPLHWGQNSAPSMIRQHGKPARTFLQARRHKRHKRHEQACTATMYWIPWWYHVRLQFFSTYRLPCLRAWPKTRCLHTWFVSLRVPASQTANGILHNFASKAMWGVWLANRLQWTLILIASGLLQPCWNLDWDRQHLANGFHRISSFLASFSALQQWPCFPGRRHQIRSHLAFIGHPLVGSILEVSFDKEVWLGSTAEA